MLARGPALFGLPRAPPAGLPRMPAAPRARRSAAPPIHPPGASRGASGQPSSAPSGRSCPPGRGLRRPGLPGPSVRSRDRGYPFPFIGFQAPKRSFLEEKSGISPRTPETPPAFSAPEPLGVRKSGNKQLSNQQLGQRDHNREGLMQPAKGIRLRAPPKILPRRVRRRLSRPPAPPVFLHPPGPPAIRPQAGRTAITPAVLCSRNFSGGKLGRLL